MEPLRTLICYAADRGAWDHVQYDFQDEANAGDKMIGIIIRKNPDIEEPGIDDLYMIGTVATIMKMVKMVDGSQRIVVQGICGSS